MELLETFKAEYDKLSIFAKFSENAFLTVFKVFRDAEDPVRFSSLTLIYILHTCKYIYIYIYIYNIIFVNI